MLFFVVRSVNKYYEMEIEDNSNADVTEELVIAAPTFQINLEIIESVEIENQ